MKLRKMFEVFGEKLGKKATASAVYGTPVQVGDRVVIPVARVQYGFGGGGKPVGGGGGLEARPVGVIEVTPEGTRFLPIEDGARLMVHEVASGITRVQEGDRTSYVLHAGGEAAIVDLPPGADFALLLRDWLESVGLTARWLCATSGAYARSAGLVEFREAFPEASMVGHRSLAEDAAFAGQNLARLMDAYTLQDWLGDKGRSLFVHIFEEPLWQGDLGGEPFFLLHAPQRTWTDHLAVFRGCALCGDCALDGLEEESQVPEHMQRQVLRDVARQLSGPYVVHTLIPAQGTPRAADWRVEVD